VHHGVSNGIAASVSLSQHQIQRRNEEKFLEEELIGSYDVYNMFRIH